MLSIEQVWVHGAGDSHMECKGVACYDGLMPQLERALNNSYGCNTACRNFGRSGDTSGLANPANGNLMERITKVWSQYTVPKLCIVEIGANDTAATPTINAAATTKNIKSMIRAGRNGVYGGRNNETQVWTNGIVDNYTNLPRGMPIGTKFLVLNDTAGSDGINATYPSGNAPSSSVAAGNRKTLGAVATNDQIWICANGGSGANGWYRTYSEEDIIAAGGTYTPTVLFWAVEGLHFYQSESGGSPSASLQTLRAAQQQAVTDLLAVVGTTKSVSSITRSSTTATATCTAHGYYTGDTVTIAGAAQSAYNGSVTITVVDANTFTYTVSGSPATPATGTITCALSVYSSQLIYLNTWSPMDKMVTAGQPKADFSYYPATSDNHLGQVGNSIVANIIADAINTATYYGVSWTNYLKG